MALSTIFPVVRALLGKGFAQRVRIHWGSNAQADLDKYGLFKEVLPEDIGGTVVLDNAKWLEDRRRLGM